MPWFGWRLTSAVRHASPCHSPILPVSDSDRSLMFWLNSDMWCAWCESERYGSRIQIQSRTRSVIPQVFTLATLGYQTGNLDTWKTEIVKLRTESQSQGLVFWPAPLISQRFPRTAVTPARARPPTMEDCKLSNVKLTNTLTGTGVDWIENGLGKRGRGNQSHHSYSL